MGKHKLARGALFMRNETGGIHHVGMREMCGLLVLFNMHSLVILVGIIG